MTESINEWLDVDGLTIISTFVYLYIVHSCVNTI